MDPNIIQIDPQTWRFEDGHVRFFLLTGRSRALLIDSGMNTPNARALAESLTGLPLMLLNTHADRDHVAGNGAFESVWMHPAESANYRAAMGRVAPIDPVWDGDVLDLGDRQLEIICIPGHTPGSVAVLDRSRRVLYSGDSVQDGGIFMFGRFRDILAFPHSLRKLQFFEERFDTIYPSHGTFPLETSVLPALLTGVERLARGELTGETAEVFGTQIRKINVGPATLLCDAELPW